MVTGFRLAGLEYALPVTKEEFEKTLEATLEKKEFGIIVVNEKMFNDIDWRLRKKLDSIAYPVVIPLPDISGGGAEGDEIKAMIKRALGFDISKK